MKRKPLTALCLGALFLLAVLTGCGIVIPRSASQASEDAGGPEGVDFSEFQYEHYDPAAIESLLSQAEALMTDRANADAVLELFDQILEEEAVLSSNYELASLYNCLDVTDEYYSAETSYSYDLFYEMDDRVSCLGKAILSSPCGDAARDSWDEDSVEYYEDYIQMTQEQLEMYSQEQALMLEYNQVSAEHYTITINGTEYDLDGLYTDATLSYSDYLEGRQAILRMQNEALGPIYLEMLSVRNQLAGSLGYDSYAEYAYDQLYNRDYTPFDAAALSDRVKRDLVEVFAAFWFSYDSTLGSKLDAMIGQMSIEKQLALVKKMLPRVNPAMEDSFDFMEQYHLYDLEYSETKLDAGFTTFLSVYNEPFLFNQRSFDFYDLVTLIHEFGHYNSFLVNREDAAYAGNIDLAEIHSQGLELLYTRFYGDMLGTKYAGCATDYTIIQKLNAVLEGCMYDEFQQQVYQLEDPTLEEVNQLFAQVCSGYGYGYEEGDEAYDWVLIPHNFDNPFYYISYAVSALSAFEIWSLSRENFSEACDLYTRLVALGETGTYAETLAECGLTSPFATDYTQNLRSTLAEYYQS